MSNGKKVGIVALVFAVLFLIAFIISTTQITYSFTTEEMIDAMGPDSYSTGQEVGNKMAESQTELGKVADKCANVFCWISFIAAIVSLVLIIKEKGTGKAFAVWAIIIILVAQIFGAFYMFRNVDMSEVMNATLQSEEM